MSPTIVGVIGIICFVLIILTRLPIALTMMLVGLIGFGYLVSVEGALNLIAQDVITTFGSYSMSVIPLYLFMGNIAFNAGISRRLYYTAYKWLGHLPGGLAIATIGGCAGFAAVCGSLTASVATMGAVALPEMDRYHYSRKLATGCVSAGGTLGVLIPPSVIFILYGIQTEQPIGKLFISGIFPGIILALLFIITIYLMCRRDPTLGPVGPSVTFKEKLKAISGAVEMLILFFIVIGGLFIGFFTPTEAGAMGALCTLLMALIRHQLTWEGFKKSFIETMKVTCMVFLLLFGTAIFGQFLAATRIPTFLAEFLVGLTLPPVIILAGILFIYFIGGCFMGGLAFMILTVPIFFPVVKTLGIDPILFGVLMVIMVEVGSITPPVGTSCYIISGMTGTPLETVFSGAILFLPAFFVCVVLLLIFPQIALFLPEFMH